MKKELFNLAIICMVAFVSMGFVSCSKDDDNGTINANAIVGTWKFTHEEGFQGGVSFSEERSSNRIRYYHIDRDGTCMEYFIDNRDGDGEWEITINPDFAFDAENKRLKFSSDWGDIVTLNNKTLKIKYIYDEEEWYMETYTKVDDSVLDGIE